MWQKLNLVTQSKGDQLQCSSCGHTMWHWALVRPHVCPKCGCLSTEQKALDGVILGGWSNKVLGNKCSRCDAQMHIVPPQGHPNSAYWELDLGDGQVLVACSKGCQE